MLVDEFLIEKIKYKVIQIRRGSNHQRKQSLLLIFFDSLSKCKNPFKIFRASESNRHRIIVGSLEQIKNSSSWMGKFNWEVFDGTMQRQIMILVWFNKLMV